jgi:glucose 1-dehydrogenase
VSVGGDSSDLTVIEKIAKSAVNSFGKLDIVIANAGITTYGSFLDYEPDSIKQLLDVNLFGTFFLIQAAAK